LQPEIVTRGSVGNAVKEGIEKRIAGLINPSSVNQERNDERLMQTKSTNDLGGLEKLLPGGARTLPIGIPGNETAKFAGEIRNFETTNSPQTITPLANPLTKPSQAAPGVEQASIHAHLRENTWSQQFGEKIVWLAKNDQQSARININPPELGPVQITLSLNGDQAKVAFSSPHLEVRQAIENAMPQLKEMLSSAGINLGQSNVGANLSQQTPDNPYQAANGKHLADENAILPANEKALNTSNSSILLRGRGLVDLFA
jgi:flagellar hook-length control protein FliK